MPQGDLNGVRAQYICSLFIKMQILKKLLMCKVYLMICFTLAAAGIKRHKQYHNNTY